jgi:pyrophosphatase PpaX
MKRYQAVLFDFDGPLMDSAGIILDSWKHLYNQVRGVDPDPAYIAQTFGEPIHETVLRDFPGRDPVEMAAIYRHYQLEMDDRIIHMFPGTEQLVKDLKAAGIRVAMVTSRMWSQSKHQNYDFGVAPLLDAVVTGEDCSAHKPDPEPILLCLEKLGVAPEDALMVGDTRFDILCARNAGVDSVLVGWGLSVTKQQRENEYRPTYYVETAEEIFDLAAGR